MAKKGKKPKKESVSKLIQKDSVTTSAQESLITGPGASLAEPPKPDKTRQKSGAKAIRDEAVIAKRLQGKKTQEIADEMGLSRQTISEILNSQDAKDRVAQIDKVLEIGIVDALKTVLDHAKFDYDAARDLLRNFGSMQDKKKVEHSGSIGLEELVAGSYESEPKKD